jgi:hypothetical protein
LKNVRNQAQKTLQLFFAGSSDNIPGRTSLIEKTMQGHNNAWAQTVLDCGEESNEFIPRFNSRIPSVIAKRQTQLCKFSCIHAIVSLAQSL